ncbi:MAG: hypothetical protein FWD01_03160 [Defluviitaleaceae bacterium]|nr:hypothetical protein [Defluviitaleaceae bacterium]
MERDELLEALVEFYLEEHLQSE